MHYNDQFLLVQNWQNAVNNQDRDRLVELSDPEIEVVGPRGSGYGQQLLLNWLERAGLHLTTLRAFVRGNTVVLSQSGVWRSVETGEVIGQATVASLFRADGQRIIYYARYDSLNIALNKAGLDSSDEIDMYERRDV